MACLIMLQTIPGISYAKLFGDVGKAFEKKTGIHVPETPKVIQKPIDKTKKEAARVEKRIEKEVNRTDENLHKATTKTGKAIEKGVRKARDFTLHSIDQLGQEIDEFICDLAAIIDDEAKCNVNVSVNVSSNGSDEPPTITTGGTSKDEAEYYQNKYHKSEINKYQSDGFSVTEIIIQLPGIIISSLEKSSDNGIQYTVKTERSWYLVDELAMEFYLPNENDFYQRAKNKSFHPIIITPGLDIGLSMTYMGWYTSYNSQIVLTNIGYKFINASPKPHEYGHLRVTGLSYKEGGVYPGSSSHRDGRDIDLSGDKINQNLPSFDRVAAVRLMAIILKEPLVTHVIYHDKSIYDEAKQLVGETHVKLIDRDDIGDHKDHIHVRVKK